MMLTAIAIASVYAHSFQTTLRPVCDEPKPCETCPDTLPCDGATDTACVYKIIGFKTGNFSIMSSTSYPNPAAYISHTNATEDDISGLRLDMSASLWDYDGTELTPNGSLAKLYVNAAESSFNSLQLGTTSPGEDWVVVTSATLYRAVIYMTTSAGTYILLRYESTTSTAPIAIAAGVVSSSSYAFNIGDDNFAAQLWRTI